MDDDKTSMMRGDDDDDEDDDYNTAYSLLIAAVRVIRLTCTLIDTFGPCRVEVQANMHQWIDLIEMRLATR